jgi:uncharacterized peroxidase-related enzyme
MGHLQLPWGLPGIVGPLAFSPKTAKPLLELAEILLRSPNLLTSAEWEMIAGHVSDRNECNFCQLSHGAAAATDLNGNCDLMEQIKMNPEGAAVSEKLKALLKIAGKVQQGGKQMSAADVKRSRREDASDKEIHDAVLIAASLCIFNRYVDGLTAWQTQDPDVYREIGQHTAGLRYVGWGYKKPLEAIAAKQGSSRKVASS